MGTVITDKNGTPVAYLHNNILLDVKNKTVIGLILGNCVFGKLPHPVGKFFKNTFRNIKGEIVAMINPEKSVKAEVDEKEIINSAWQILMQVKEHVCNWVQESHEWSKQSLLDYLSHS